MPIMSAVAKLNISMRVDPGALLLIGIGALCIWGIMHFANSDKVRHRVRVFLHIIYLNVIPEESPIKITSVEKDKSEEEIFLRKKKARENRAYFLSRLLATLVKAAKIFRDCLWMVLVSLAIIITTYLIVNSQ